MSGQKKKFKVMQSKPAKKQSDFKRVKALYEAATGREYRVTEERFATRSGESDTVMDEAMEIISLLSQEEFHSFLGGLIRSGKGSADLCLEVVAFFHDRTIKGFEEQGPIGLFAAATSHMIGSYHEGDSTYQFDSGSKTYTSAEMESIERIHSLITQTSNGLN